MAVFRVEKTRNYTVMSKHHLRDKSLSLKAKGLLSLMLSLPEDWDYTTKGLARICKDGVDSICATVRELEGAGYIVRARECHADGTLGGIEYTILEQLRGMDAPKRENPVQVENAGDAPKRAFPEQVKPEQENPAQLNKEEQSKEELNTDVMNSFLSFPHESKTTQENGMERRETYLAAALRSAEAGTADPAPAPASAGGIRHGAGTAEGSDSTGTEQPYGLDCSGFVDWTFYNASSGAYVIGQGGGAAEQHANCVDIEWDEVQPGDLLFYPEDEHVGIAAGRDWLGRLLVVHCASGTDGVAISHRTGFEIVARPVWYTDE